MMKNAWFTETTKEAKRERRSAKRVKVRKEPSCGQETEKSIEVDEWLESKTKF